MRSFYFILLLIITISVHGQDTEPEMVIEMPLMNCDGKRSYVDALLIELNKEPDAIGVIKFYADRAHPLTPYKLRSSIGAHLIVRRFDKDRILFVLGNDETKFRAELWKVPKKKAGEFTGKAFDFKLNQLSVPLLVNIESWENGLGCEFMFTVGFYADFLKENPDIFGRLVIHENSLKNFEKRKKEITRDLVDIHKVNKSQLQFGFIRSNTKNLEYWYIPNSRFF